MFGIDGILSIVLNGIFDIKDAIENGKATSLSSTLISLECVVTDDLPVDVRNEYCKALQVNYAMLIRSLLNVQSYGRGNSNPKAIYRSIPLLTPYDSVKYDEKIGGFLSVKDNLFRRNYNGSNALSVFTESMEVKVLDMYKNQTIACENVLSNDGLASFSPTFVELEITVNQVGGKSVNKRFTLAVQVRPKVVSVQDMVSFIAKRNLSVATPSSQSVSFWTRMKNKFTFNSKRIEHTEKTNRQEEKTLTDMMNQVSGIKKPFVCLLMSNVARDMLRQGGIEVTKAAVAQKIYGTLPVLSIGIYDTNTDMITVSLLGDANFETRTAGEFNSQVSQYQRQLSELVRVSRYA